MTWVAAAAVGVVLAGAGRTSGAPTVLAENGQARFPVKRDRVAGHALRHRGPRVDVGAASRREALIDDLTLYVRYLELYRDYRGAPVADGRKQAAYETLARYAYRTRRSGMINVKAWFVVSNVNGQFALLNVPPYLARSLDELLVPAANPAGRE